MSTTQPLLSTQAVAERLGVHEDLVRKLAKQQAIPSLRVGSRVLRFSLPDVVRALEQRTASRM